MKDYLHIQANEMKFLLVVTRYKIIDLKKNKHIWAELNTYNLSNKRITTEMIAHYSTTINYRSKEDAALHLQEDSVVWESQKTRLIEQK